MKQHEQKFDPALETLWEQGVKLKSFLRNGRVGEAAVALSEEQTDRFEKAYADRLGKLSIRLSVAHGDAVCDGELEVIDG